MLALLSRGTSKFLDVRLVSGDENAMSPEDVEAYSIDINSLGALLPHPNFPWRQVAGVCGQTISPVYKCIQNMLNTDVEHLATLLSELAPLDEVDELDIDDDDDQNNDAGFVPQTNHTRLSLHTSRVSRTFRDSTPSPCRRRRRRSTSPLDHPILIPSSHPSAPSILITPCPNFPDFSSSSWVPLQNASFGNQLAVPGHPHLNSCHAPLIPRPGHVPLMERWKWREGHWWALVPDIDSQVQRGWFSRPIHARRKASRPCRTVQEAHTEGRASGQDALASPA